MKSTSYCPARRFQAEIESSVYSQVSGYIKRWLVDIGAPVKEGQLLAEIETPVTDQQLMQAQAATAQAQANPDPRLKQAARYNNLLNTNAVSQQDVDHSKRQPGRGRPRGQSCRRPGERSRLGTNGGLQGGQGPLRRSTDRARKVDVGDLVAASGATTSSPGNAPSQSGTPSQELFRVAQTKTLRVYVNIPENFSDAIVPGISATLDLASSPGQKVTGKLARTSQAIDPGSLTLLAEVDVPNADGKLLPGGYAQVHFDITTKHPPLVIPGNTLIFRAQGTQVGVVDLDTNTVHLKDIKIGRDFGTKLEVVDGLDPKVIP